MQTYSQAIAAVGTWRLGVPGSYFRLLSLTGPVDVQFLRHGTVVFAAGQVMDGFWSKPAGGFDEVIVTSASAQTVTLGITTGDAGYDRAAGSVSITNVNGAFTNTGKTVTNASAQLLAANAARRFLLVQNKDASGNIWVTLDGSAATAGNGVKISPGGSLILDTYAPTGEIRAIGDIASNVNIVTVEG